MESFIKLTRDCDNESIYINAKHIVSFIKHDDLYENEESYTVVETVNGTSWSVSETCDEILNMVKEMNLAEIILNRGSK